ncbi:MAG TPA: Gfo/Idh/MocA family oxidoreductase [Verrucomicrobiae bacterium]|nr:Gfo/Idh/MocA family oxidoreductase [Verrucomicrobiae bacterium]
MKPLRIGLIGASGRGVLAKQWHRPETGESIVVAAADIAPKALAEFKLWAGREAFVTEDYHQLLAFPGLDAIGIFSPDYLHEEHVVAALQARKHVYLEKPMAISTASCDRILRAWRESGVKLMMGFNMRYMPIVARAKELIEAGTIGEPKAIWVRHFVGAGGDFYYHDWHANRRNTLSLLLQKATHDFDVIHWLGGAYSRRVAAFGGLDYFGGDKPNTLTCPTCADAAACPEVQEPANPRQQCVFRSEVDVEDNHVVILELENGIKAAYLQCHFAPEYLRNYVVIGTKGRLEMEVERLKLWTISRPDGRAWETSPVRTDHPIDSSQGWHGGADPLIAQAFLDMLLRGIEPISNPLAGRMSVAVGCEAVRSLREGGIRQVPAVPPQVTRPSRRLRSTEHPASVCR